MPRRPHRYRRPLPVLPRGQRPDADRAEAHAPQTRVLACPRISPQWELAAQLALVKPKPYTKSAMGGHDPRQRWPRTGRAIVDELLGKLPAGTASVRYPRDGDQLLIIEINGDVPGVAKRFARRLSRALPELWFTLTPSTYVCDGQFYRRCGKYNLELVRTTRVKLRRAIRFGFLGDVDDAIAPARD
jgi:hypothetical protein